MIWRESRFDAARMGGKGEIGLMQVTEGAAQEWAEDRGVKSFVKSDLFDPRVNVQAGTWYLARAIKRWSTEADPLPYALAEYNAGRSRATRWAETADGNSRKFWEDIPFKTTKHYIRDILVRYRGKV